MEAFTACSKRQAKGSCATGRLKPSRAWTRTRSLHGSIHGMFQASNQGELHDRLFEPLARMDTRAEPARKH